VTWAELFILFDTAGMRAHGSDHVIDTKAKQRADARRKAKATKEDRNGRSKRQCGSAVVKPVYEAEIQRFKAIVRQIAKHELEPQQSNLFKMEGRSRLRRLAGLGIYGHQPGIAAHVAITPEEEERVVEAILRQKVGSCSKTMKQYREHIAHRNVEVDAKVRVRIARIATRTIVKWERKRRSQEEEKEQEDQGGMAWDRAAPMYDSRVLYCSRCGTPQETRWMQLRTDKGYRAIHCKRCKKQETVARTRCQCNVVWHRCEVHRIDPATHSSRKGRKGTNKNPKAKPEKQEVIHGPKRKAPLITEKGPSGPAAEREGVRRMQKTTSPVTQGGSCTSIRQVMPPSLG